MTYEILGCGTMLIAHYGADIENVTAFVHTKRLFKTHRWRRPGRVRFSLSESATHYTAGVR